MLFSKLRLDCVGSGGVLCGEGWVCSICLGSASSADMARPLLPPVAAQYALASEWQPMNGVHAFCR